MRVLLLLLCPAVALGGCTLIDQRTFERAGRAPDQASLARAGSLPPLPLLTIRFDNPDIDIQPVVTQAAEAVLTRKADADYDVVTPIPTNATPAVQQTFATLGQQDSAAVVQALGYAGVSLDRVHVGYRGDPGSPAREVDVFVR